MRSQRPPDGLNRLSILISSSGTQQGEEDGEDRLVAAPVVRGGAMDGGSKETAETGPQMSRINPISLLSRPRAQSWSSEEQRKRGREKERVFPKGPFD